MKMKILQGIVAVVGVLALFVLISINSHYDDLNRTCNGLASIGNSYATCMQEATQNFGFTLIVLVICAIVFVSTAFTRKGFFSRSTTNPPPQPISNYPKANPPVPSGTTSSSIENELQKAAEMLKKGLIDEEEYKALKKKIIEKT